MLARTLGFPTRQAMYEALTAEELTEWEVDYDMEPWGPKRGDLQAAIVASAAVSPHCKPGHRPKLVDYMPYVDRHAPRQSVEEQKAIFASVKRAWSKPKKGKNNG